MCYGTAKSTKEPRARGYYARKVMDVIASSFNSGVPLTRLHVRQEFLAELAHDIGFGIEATAEGPKLRVLGPQGHIDVYREP